MTGNGLYSALSYSIPTPGLAQTDIPNGPHNTFVIILSEAGIFTGDPADNLGWFVSDLDHQITGQMGIDEPIYHNLGRVVGDEWVILGKREVDPYADLTFKYFIPGTPGDNFGHLIVIPEPSTVVMVLGAGVLALLAWAWRGRRG